tara:strand:- start:105 stop:248 length:144 start_codon:yes stop_codon:yes gene_type:complete
MGYYNCECGSTVHIYKQARHEKSKKHIKLMKEIEENEVLLKSLSEDK